MMKRDFDEKTITDAVIERFAATPDPRLKQIMESLTRHLHDFVRDIEPTMQEWEYAIGFLTRTGHLSDDKRQEFILLSDTLGVSMLVDAINHRMPDGATETTVLGPFYVQNPPELPDGSDISGTARGEPLYFSGTVTTPEGAPLANAWVDVWQSDDDGYYDVQKLGAEPNLRARFRSDADGRFTLWTIVPTFYPIPADGTVGAMLTATRRHPYRPAHIHFMIGADGFETLVTHLFIKDDPYLDSDAVFGVKASLIVDLARHAPGTAPDGRAMAGEWTSHSHRFGLKPKE
jgi:hydroxyquinol 1,2-dioxygenase